MSMQRTILVFTLTASTGFLFLAIGCEDAETQAAVDRSDAISAASRSYASTLAQPEREQALNGLASELAAGAGEPDAGAIIEATAARDVAAVQLNEAAVLEAENRGDRAAMAGMARGALRLNALAGAYSSFDQSTDAAAIEAAAAEAGQTLQAVQDAIAELERPVADLESQNQQDRQEVERLRTQARAAYDKAFELGDLNGFPDFQKAVDFDKQADVIEDRIVQREIELLDLTSQLAFAQTQAEELAKQIDAAQQARTSLDESADRLQQSAATMQGRTSDIGRAFGDALQRVQERMDRLTVIYERAAAKIDSAVSKAGSAGGGEGANILKVRALQMKGEIYDMKARGLADHAALLNTLSSAESVGDASQFRSALQVATQNLQVAAAAATAAYQEASEALGAAGGNAQQTARLKQRLDAAASGQPVAAAPPAGGGERSAPAAPAGAGAESPEALVAAINEIHSRDPLAAAQSLVSLSTPDQLTGVERQAYDVFGELIAAATSLDATLQAKFSQRLVDVDEGFGQLLTMLLSQFPGDATLLDVSGDRGSVTSNGEEEPIVQVSGRWYMLLEPEPDTTGAEFMAEMFQPMATAYQDIDARIRAGELATIEAVQQAIDEVSSQMMGDDLGN